MIESPSGGTPEKVLDGISRVQKVAAVEKWIRGSVSDRLGVRRYIYEEGVRRWSHEGPTRVGARLPPWARLPALWPPRRFLDVHSKTPGLCLFQKSLSRRFHSVWTPFDILFIRNTEISKKTAILGWVSS